MFDRHGHWEAVYREKRDHELSWHQDEPSESLGLIREVAPPGVGVGVSVIDVGGGASVLAGRLVEAGYGPVAVLDIAESALARARERIGSLAENVRWIAGDVTEAGDLGAFDVWHDRAVFHFLTEAAERARYAEVLRRSLVPGGHAIIGCFAPDGPEKCSGLAVARADAAAIAAALGDGFVLVRSERRVHTTPWGKAQSFEWAVLRRG
jgi:SAM-dependent methyltransferase